MKYPGLLPFCYRRRVSAQKAERDYIRKGNRLFNDSVFVDAEALIARLEVNPKSAASMYNLKYHNKQKLRGPWSNMILPAK